MKRTLNSAAKISVDKVLQSIPVQSSFTSNARRTLDLKITTLLSVLAAFRQHIETLGRPITLRPTTVYQPDYMERSEQAGASPTQILDYAINSVLREMNHSRKRFGKKLDALEAAFSAVQDEITPRIIHLIQCWNSSQPFHQLPIEIIADVLCMAADQESYIEEYHYKLGPNHRPIFLQTLSLVSSSWASIVRNTPSLWSFISSADSPKFISTALKHSKGYPLTLSCRWASNLRAEQAFLAATIPHTHRWRSASISVTCGRHLLELPNGAALILEDLSLWSHGSEFSGPVLPFGGVAPKLRSFKACNAHLPWNSTMLLDLEVLEISTGEESVGPSVTQIFTILASSPRLESFKIDSTPCIDDSSQLDIIIPIDLPRLRCFHLMTISGSFPQQLLSTLRAPSCSELHITFHDIPPHEVEPLIRAVKRSMDQVIPCARLMVAAAPAIELQIDGRDLRFQVVTPDGAPCLSVHFGNAGFILAPWISDVLGNSHLMPQPPVISLQVSPAEFMEDQELISILDSFPWIDNLEFPTYSRDDGRVRALLQYLSRPLRNEHDDAGIITWPVPRLKELKFSGRQWPGEALMEMVDARYGDAARSHLDGGVEPPSTLRHLTVFEPRQMANTNFEEKLKNVLGRDVVEWVDWNDDDDESGEEMFADDGMFLDDGLVPWGTWPNQMVFLPPHAENGDEW